MAAADGSWIVVQIQQLARLLDFCPSASDMISSFHLNFHETRCVAMTMSYFKLVILEKISVH